MFDILDLQEQRVRRLLRGEPGVAALRVDWDDRDDAGRQMPSGAYFCNARAGGLRAVRKVTLVK